MEILQDDKVNFELLLEVAKQHREYVASLPKTEWIKIRAPFLDNCEDFERIFSNHAQYEKIINSLSYHQLLDFAMEMTNSIDDLVLIFDHPYKYDPSDLKETIQHHLDEYNWGDYKYSIYKLYNPLLLLYKSLCLYYDGKYLANSTIFLADLCRNFKAHNREVPKELEYAIVYAIKYRYNMIKDDDTELADLKDLLDYMQNKIPMNEQIFNTLFNLPTKDISVKNTIEKGYHFANKWVTLEAYEAACRLDGVKPERDRYTSERLMAKFMKMINPYRYGTLDLSQDNEHLFAVQEAIWRKLDKTASV